MPNVGKIWERTSQDFYGARSSSMLRLLKRAMLQKPRISPRFSMKSYFILMLEGQNYCQTNREWTWNEYAFWVFNGILKPFVRLKRPVLFLFLVKKSGAGFADVLLPARRWLNQPSCVRKKQIRKAAWMNTTSSGKISEMFPAGELFNSMQL